ncbi:MAG: FG-GAP repeat protein, partial [Blastocatellia bacterium]
LLSATFFVPGDISAQTFGFQATVVLGDQAGAHICSRSQLSIKLQHPHPIAVGDFNGDGVADLAVAEPDEGKVFVLFGPINRPATIDLASQPGVILSGPVSTGYSLAVVRIGGRDTLVIGAPDLNCVWVVPVSGSVPIALDPLTAPSGGLLLQPDSAFSFGASIVALSGDRLAIGAPDSGLAYIAALPATTGSLTLTPENALKISGSPSFGVAIGEADLSGVGIKDLIVGAPGADRPGISEQPAPNTGAVFQFHGPSATGALTADQATMVRYGENTGDAYGFEIATQDLNDDGIADLVVSAPFWAGGGLIEPPGANVTVYFSSPQPGSPQSALLKGCCVEFGFTMATGAFQAGVPALLVGAPESTSNSGWIGEYVSGPTFPSSDSNQAYIPQSQFFLGQQFGRAFAVGDLDGDGAADLIVAEPQFSPDGRSGAGALQIFWGTVKPLVVTPSALPNGMVGASYQSALTPTGGVGPYHYRGVSMPPGLLVDTLSGAITGIPTQSGDITTVISVFDTLGESLPIKLPIHIAEATPTGPEIDGLQLNGKNLAVTGKRFDGAAVVLVNGTPVKRTVDQSTTALIGKKAVHLIPLGATVTI